MDILTGSTNLDGISLFWKKAFSENGIIIGIAWVKFGRDEWLWPS
ncbi:hypothetical protein [Xanthobacter versatilis]